MTNNWNTSAVCVTGEYTNYLTGTQYTNNSSFAEMYSYHPAGGVIAKQLYLSRQYPTSYGNYWTTQTTDIEVDYTYDNTGRTATTKYPMAAPSSWYNNGPGGEALGPITLTYGYDSMGRPASLTDNSGATGASWGQTSSPVDWVQNVQYDYAGRMTSMQAVVGSDYNSGSYVTSWATRTMAYNVNGQLASLSWSTNPDAYGRSSPAVGIQYNYSATQNNGQITQAVDTLSGETISYQYDLLKRLTSASSTPNSGASPAPSAWTQTYQYDGFGNLTAKVLNGTSTPIAVNSATNRLSNASYDANGNMTSGSGATLTYDESNRVFSAAETSGGIEYFAYTADNKRFYTYTTSGTEQLTFYGARGEKLGVYTIVPPNSYVGTPVSITPTATNIWFAGKLIVETGQMTYQDRLGTNRAIGVWDYYAPTGNGGRFYPYGDEITSTSNDHEKFATYTRDSYTGFDYADQRYYASTYGRFNTADQYQAGAGPKDPGSWNRYAYTGGDPVNRFDRTGRAWEEVCSGQDGESNDASCAGGGATFWASACPQLSQPGIAAWQDPAAMDPDPGCYTLPETSLPTTPTCDQELANSISALLTSRGSPLASYSGWFVAVGMLDNIDPRLLVAMSGAESGYGTSPVAQKDDNAFGSMVCQRAREGIWNCHPRQFSSFGQSISFTGDNVENQIYNKGNNTVAKLYSGLPGAYCVNQPGFPCSNGAGNITSIMVGLGGNPNSLGFPCPPPAAKPNQ